MRMLRIRLKWVFAGALPPQTPISSTARSAVPPENELLSDKVIHNHLKGVLK
jgi:hypothetical protein